MSAFRDIVTDVDEAARGECLMDSKPSPGGWNRIVIDVADIRCDGSSAGGPALEGVRSFVRISLVVRWSCSSQRDHPTGSPKEYLRVGS